MVNNMFSTEDKKYMRLALKEAELAYKRDEYPVAAVLAIDGKLIGKGINSLVSSSEGITHAEMNLIKMYSSLIIKSRSEGKTVVLYTTLEPCLMCLGTSVLHKISKIVYASKDPDGGATNLFKKKLTGYYARKWPMIEGGLYQRESYVLLMKFLDKQTSPGWIAVRDNLKKLNSKMTK